MVNLYKTPHDGNLKYNMIDIHTNGEERGFINACLNGHLHIVEYLLYLHEENQDYSMININAQNELGFKLACMKGHINIVKCLINLHEHNKIDIHSSVKKY